METETTIATKPKRTVSPELKARMRAGRERAAALRKAADKAWDANRRKLPLSPEGVAEKRKVKASPQAAPREFLGITRTDCPVDCTFERCIITGIGQCGHPCKGGIQSVHMSNPETFERYNRARKHLAHVELDKRP